MDLREINFGVEIETVKRTRERVARAIHSVVGGEVRHTGRPASFDPWEVVDDQGRTWKVVSDGSLINVPGHLRAEVVSPVLAYADIPTLEEDAPVRISVPPAVWQGIDAVRLSGLTNMLDRPAVVRIARELGFPEAARWIETHTKEYTEGVFRGFIVEAQGGKP